MPTLSPRSPACQETPEGLTAPPSAGRCSYRASDLARCLAEAIRESSDGAAPPQPRGKPKKPNKRRGKKKNKDVFNGQFGRRKSVDENENNLLNSYSSMVYSEVVRNSILRKIDLSNILPPSSNTSNESPANVKDSAKYTTDLAKKSEVLNELHKMYSDKSKDETNKLIAEQAILDRSLTGNVDLALKLENDLKNVPDFELIEDATWELVSLSDCSSVSCSEDDFQLLSDEDEEEDEHQEKGIHESCGQKEKTKDQNESSPLDSTTEVDTPPKKKYIAATRKFIGGADFESKMEKLGFENEGQDESGCQHFSGEFMNSLMNVEVTCRCGVRVVSVRCLSENILECLNTLHCLMKTTGLNSYSNVSIPASGGEQ